MSYLVKWYGWLRRLPNWVSWLIHGVIAALISWSVNPEAARLFYGLREAEQILVTNDLKDKWLDHLMDFLVPLTVSLLPWW